MASDDMRDTEVGNLTIAARLEEVAQLLEQQGASVFRVRAYRRAARAIARFDRSVADILAEQGVAGLEALPAIGQSIAESIRQLVAYGRLAMLERLRGEADPIKLLASVPGIGRRLARRIHDDLHIDTLEQLEAAAHDGRLATIEGFGTKRLSGIRDTLTARLGRFRAETHGRAAEPPVGEVLDVDREYLQRVRAGTLRLIAPRRFNPNREAWLPILHTHRGRRHYTALFSNTARAHQLGKTDDWVVIYFDNGRWQQQCTVVTEPAGPLAGRRVVRGREEACAQYYRGRAGAPSPVLAAPPARGARESQEAP